MLAAGYRHAPSVDFLISKLRVMEAPKTFLLTVRPSIADVTSGAPNGTASTWLQDGLYCVELLRALAGHSIIDIAATSTPASASPHINCSLEFADGSFGVIHFCPVLRSRPAAMWHRLEVFCEERVLQLENLTELRTFGFRGWKLNRAERKRPVEQAVAGEYLRRLETQQTSPEAFAEIIEAARATIAIAVAARLRETDESSTSLERTAAESPIARCA